MTSEGEGGGRFDSHLDELLGDEQSLGGDLIEGVSHARHHGRDQGGDVGVEGVSGMRDHDDVETRQRVDFEVGAARLIVQREDDTWRTNTLRLLIRSLKPRCSNRIRTSGGPASGTWY